MEPSTSHSWLGQVVILASVLGLSVALSMNSSSSRAAPTDELTPPSRTTPLTTSQIALTTEQEEALFSDSTPYRYIVVRDSLSPRLEELRAMHPEAEILLYKDLAFTAVDPECEFDPMQGAGLSECQAREHETWYLHGADGSRLISQDFAELSAMDIASPGYRKAWLKSVMARLGDADDDGTGVAYDGVWIDDANLYPGHGLDGLIAELDDAEYGQEAIEFIEEIAPQIQAQGFDAVLNLGMRSDDEEHREGALRLAGTVSMINREQFVRFGEGPALFTAGGGEAPLWEEELTLMEGIQAAGAEHHAIVYGTEADTEAQLYARATFLLGWDGQDGTALNYRTTDTTAPASDWTQSLGLPTGERDAVGVGWMRSFEEGVVLVNPSPDESQAFALPEPHASPGAACEAGVELAPTSARMVFPC